MLGIVLTFQTLRKPAQAVVLRSSPEPWTRKKALAYLALLLFIFALEPIGFISAFTFLVAFLLKIEEVNWRRALAIALASGLAFYLFFIRLLAVDLPPGPLGF
jgi:hypothetical protein